MNQIRKPIPGIPEPIWKAYMQLLLVLTTVSLRVYQGGLDYNELFEEWGVL